jgi:hypothetical protein
VLMHGQRQGRRTVVVAHASQDAAHVGQLSVPVKCAKDESKPFSFSAFSSPFPAFQPNKAISASFKLKQTPTYTPKVPVKTDPSLPRTDLEA